MMNEYIHECGEPSTSIDKSKEINRTYTVSATSACSQKNDTCSRGRLTLQRRKTDSKGGQRAEKTVIEPTENHVEVPEKRLTLQRRTRTGSTDKSSVENSKSVENQGVHINQKLRQSKILSEPNCRTPRATSVLRSSSTRDAWSKGVTHEKVNLIYAQNKVHTRFLQMTVNEPPATKADSGKAEDRSKIFSTPTKKTPFEKISAKKDVFERLAGRDIPKSAKAKSASLERQRNLGLANGESLNKPTGQVSTFRSAPVGSQGRNVTSSLQFTQVKKAPTLTSSSQNGNVSGAGSKTPGRPTSSIDLLNRESSVLKQDSLKMENSAVTVAVRVRPFNSREKTENGQQVIFMNNQETTVQHPDSKQSYTFNYDFSFCSIDKTDPNFASQKTVYEKLARPLLERAFEGFNTCLFAYGQTGSGKSYTMMGFGEDAGVTPRFCEELFSRVIKSQNNQVSCRLEMSYFEVYNEKIHDLLVVRDEQGEKKLPLRVREHPVFGPYVADLSTIVVSSYADIQSWLELGNKQRATAATGMNDKSSRSHSVFTLVMTQTKTEFVEEEEHDHTVTSRINLVDLAGSERCSSAQTSEDRLREGASINKSLLTLGKVISALSEQSQSRKKVFTPYRESVLTWLLKESLGGNSKTAMIATLSPAASSVEETLSTLRYARQARLIINIAKVNEDNNAKLIRELKAEVDKLRAAQMSTKGIEPEKMRLFQQEIAALKTQLTQQEREMAEAHRKWKEKLEHAEKRKREETKELQKAGITFKVDNRLPNLVNLNEDPQLSEMLLYMIKEGQTKVGKRKSESAHDIQLSGALIADEHCVISNVSGTVSITPIKDAKTFVNGNLVSEPTVLHHGDRVILGGDHYFRFNHPVEVHSGKRVSCWTQAGDGHKDFEFAKNELLAAQRAQLEAEIAEARVKAKEEMMQGIQVAKEMAQKELTEQKALYENKIKALERELEEENERKKLHELDKQRAASKMEKLQNAKIQLEQEVHMNKKRLNMEAQATRQAMADHDIRHAKILEALEEEKRKIADDLERMQKKIAQKEVHSNRNVLAPPQWDAMKLSVMIEEANAISKKLGKNTVFSRHELSDKDRRDGEGELQVQVQNTKLGISTFWSLEKFQSNLAAMRELEQGDGASKDDDVFYDPNDEWEPDLSASSSASSFSRRRSRSLLKSRRISGRLYEIRVHPIQSLHSSQHSGLMGVSKTPSLHPSGSDSALPGICKELIGSALARLRGSHGAEESVADRLVWDLLAVHAAVLSISGTYEGLDDDSQENLFVCNEEAQTQLVRATSAIERAVFLTLQWITSIKPSSGPVFHTAEELRREVKKMGGYFQLLIQGCDSEISSMVTEARGKISQCLDVAVRFVSQLSAVTGTELHLTEAGSEALGKRSVVTSLLEGACKGTQVLLEDVIHQAKELQRDAQLSFPRTEVLQSLKTKSLDVASSLRNYVSCNQTQRDWSSERAGEDADPSHLRTVRDAAAQLLQLSLAVGQLRSALTQALRGKDKDFSRSRDAICSISKTIDDIISGLPKLEGSVWAPRPQLPCAKSVVVARDELHSALCSLSSVFDQICVRKSKLSGPDNRAGKAEVESGSDGENAPAPSNSRRDRTVPKTVYTLSSNATFSPSDIRWV
ncbi:kinesin-like protein KIF14 [Anguilla anguilla]|uniref:kinesin-like protein KIF14 n=1 Tax=Anguilla anguilla TaxID=7936 RepID=UPI0015AF4B18|nr:kinesin-like protein KIF14 [Anguilla anguilla]